MTFARDAGDIGHILYRNNLLINPQFEINQRVWASGGNLALVGDYGPDRWCAAIADSAPTLSDDILTIPAGDAVKQIVEDLNIPNGDYTISWEGTSQVSIDGGADQSSPYSFTISSGTHVTVEFGEGTLQQPMLVPGNAPLPFVRRDITSEIALCQRYFQKSYNLTTAPGTASSTGSYVRYHNQASSAAYIVYDSMVFATVMRTAPTIVFFSPISGASGTVRVNSGDVAPGNIAIADSGYRFSATDSVVATNRQVQWHFTGDAELT